MKTKDLPDKILDCAFEVAIISFPGMIPADKQAKEAYKKLAGSLMLKPVKSIKRVLPGRIRTLRAGDESFLGTWSPFDESTN